MDAISSPEKWHPTTQIGIICSCVSLAIWGWNETEEKRIARAIGNRALAPPPSLEERQLGGTDEADVEVALARDDAMVGLVGPHAVDFAVQHARRRKNSVFLTYHLSEEKPILSAVANCMRSTVFRTPPPMQNFRVFPAKTDEHFINKVLKHATCRTFSEKQPIFLTLDLDDAGLEKGLAKDKLNAVISDLRAFIPQKSGIRVLFALGGEVCLDSSSECRIFRLK